MYECTYIPAYMCVYVRLQRNYPPSILGTFFLQNPICVYKSNLLRGLRHSLNKTLPIIDNLYCFCGILPIRILLQVIINDI